MNAEISETTKARKLGLDIRFKSFLRSASLMSDSPFRYVTE